MWHTWCSSSDFIQGTEQIPFYGVVNRLLVIPTDTVKTVNWVHLLNIHAEKATTSYKFPQMAIQCHGCEVHFHITYNM
jgi:hypothetical protein